MVKMIQDTPDQEPESSPGISLNDILRMFFKHKWKLIFFSLLGLGGAAYVYLTHVPEYSSTSKIFVRYVREVSNVDLVDDGGRTDRLDGMMNAEMEILHSWDLASEVVDAVTPAVILGYPGATRSDAAQAFLYGLDIDLGKGSQVISVSYRHRDPDVAVKGLNALIGLYLQKHVDIHRSSKSRETSRARRADLTAKITELTEQIEQLKAENGISSLNEAADGLNKRSDELAGELEKAEVDLQEQVARLNELKRLGLVKDGNPVAVPDKPATDSLPEPPGKSALREYQSLMRELTKLQDDELTLLGNFTRQSEQVRSHRARMAEVEARCKRLEAENPGLLASGPALSGGAAVLSTVDPLVETVRLATLSARVDFLKKRREALQNEFKQFAVLSKRMHALERERDMQQKGMDQFAATFQRTEFETPLKAEDYDNIVILQRSSPPSLAINKLMKTAGAIGAAGMGFGVALVLFLELFVHRTVKRPLEIETRLGIPLMLNIPRVSGRARRALPRKRDAAGRELAVAGMEAWSHGHFIRPYAEALRDRLVLYFEQIGLTRKPKLVGVTAHSKGAGVSTIASGIAAALSETGDGKVLLVDMNVARAEVHPFFEGKPAASLTDALAQGDKIESAAENLYLATAASGSGGGQLFPKRFYDMIPRFQASDFDYIIFDMPPMDESSLSLAMSGFMDHLLLVVEAEKDNRDAVKRASSELLRARAKLSGVFNKARSYGPKWLQEA